MINWWGDYPLSSNKVENRKINKGALKFCRSSYCIFVNNKFTISLTERGGRWETMAAAGTEEANGSNDFVYRISTAEEWEELQITGSILGGELDKSTGCIHLSNIDQVQSTLQNFFLNTKKDLYLLQIDSKKLGEGLVYEAVDGLNFFPHFYGPSRSFSPLPLDAVAKAEKLTSSDGQFSCSLLS
ncbi:hypothetical protein NMG60_11035155 [Bertholletia excelsa]